jgi:hypothetical protein
MRRALILLSILATYGLAPRSASAQRIPFFFPAGTGFDPEISVVNSGEVLDAQAVVSHDLKYVTINTRAASSNLLALREFTFQSASGVRLGFVGGAAQQQQALARANARRNNPLDRPGMTLVGRLDD